MPGVTKASLWALLRAPIIWLLIVFLGVGTTYIANTPPFETPDEYGHYAYVRYLAEERRLPPLIISDHEWIQGQMHQPPLYYALGAALVGMLDTPEWQTAYPRNPLARLGDPETPVHKNAVLHPGVPTAATTRTATALRLLRGFSLLLSAVTVWLTYRLALLIVPDNLWFASGAAAVVAFNPQFLFIGASVNNDVLVTALSAAVLYLSTHVAREGDPSWRTPLAIGLLVGLAALAKLSGIATLVLPASAYLLYLLHQRTRDWWRGLVRPLLLTGAVALLVSGGWFLRNALLYRDPLGMSSYAAVFAVHEQSLSLGTALRIMREALPSYWGVFGWLNVLAPFRFYQVVYDATLVIIAGLAVQGVRLWIRRKTLNPAGVRAALIAGLWALVVLALLVRWTQTITRTQGRLAFPAAGVFALFIVTGLTGLVPDRWRRALVALVGSAMLVVAAVMPWRVIAPAYHLDVTMPYTELPAHLSPVNVRFGDDLTLLAAEVLSPEAVEGDYVWVRMYWQADRELDDTYIEAVQLVGASGERLGGLDTPHAMGRYPTNAWDPSEITIDNAILPVERSAGAPVAAAVRLAVYRDSPDEPLPAYDGEGRALGTLAEIGRLRMVPDDLDLPVPQRPVVNDFGGMRLYGYDLDIQPAAGGATLNVHSTGNASVLSRRPIRSLCTWSTGRAICSRRPIRRRYRAVTIPTTGGRATGSETLTLWQCPRRRWASP